MVVIVYDPLFLPIQQSPSAQITRSTTVHVRVQNISLTDILLYMPLGAVVK